MVEPPEFWHNARICCLHFIHKLERYVKSISLKLLALLILLLPLQAASAADKPNILIIWGDDIGWFNVSHNNSGMMGFQTPNIDRIANEGIRFTDAYGENSCTAGRATFITGQSAFRTGLLKVGLPAPRKESARRTRPSPVCSRTLSAAAYSRVRSLCGAASLDANPPLNMRRAQAATTTRADLRCG